MNILMLTSVYKDKSLGNIDRSTDVINSFVYEWVKMGHRVIVIHNAHSYPVFIQKLPFFIKSYLETKINFFIADYEAVSEKQYEDNGVKIWRIPILKLVPHKTPGDSIIRKQVKKINNVLKKENFEPDIIVGHWASPQMEMISELKKFHPCRNAVVLHGNGYINTSSFPTAKYLKNIDKIGCRSVTQAKQVKDLLNLKEMPFVCYSGVPDKYLQQFKLNLEKFKDIKVWKFIYVGRLVHYKRVDVIIKALSMISEQSWQLDIVGDGSELDNLKRTARESGCEERVIFHGRIPRDDVMTLMKDAHCFVMVSKGEVFGLVYLEAMAASCVAIGSLREGIDGIIVDGENGMLCEPADVNALYNKIQQLLFMNAANICNMVTKGYASALCFSDSNVAKTYLNNVIV